MKIVIDALDRGLIPVTEGGDVVLTYRDPDTKEEAVSCGFFWDGTCWRALVRGPAERSPVYALQWGFVGSNEDGTFRVKPEDFKSSTVRRPGLGIALDPLGGKEVRDFIARERGDTKNGTKSPCERGHISGTCPRYRFFEAIPHDKMCPCCQAGASKQQRKKTKTKVPGIQ